MPHQSHQPRLQGEAGAILPMFALLIVVLMIFAAFTVDLGAAWAERRHDQTAADAAAMAAALQYLHEDSPSSTSTIERVIEYVSLNIPNAPTRQEWIDCVENPKPDPDFVALTDGVDTYDCISLKQVANEPALLHVKVPERSVPTSFARLIGIDAIDVSASATAEILFSEASNVLPFSLPADHSNNECLGTPPEPKVFDDYPGIQDPGDASVNVCDGPDSGNFGLIDSPNFGAGPPHNTGDTCDNRFKDDRQQHQLALGLDHIVTTWPVPPPPVAPVPGVDGPITDPSLVGYDDCDSADGGVVPFMIGTSGGFDGASGNPVVSNGLIGASPSAWNPGALGRLRQDGGLNDGVTGLGELPDTLTFASTSQGSFDLDNVGLWQYLSASASGACASGNFGDQGRLDTEAMIDCLGAGSGQDFDKSILTSPRFAVVPVLHYNRGGLTGTAGSWGIVDMVPVYLQMSWYACDKPGTYADYCTFQPVNGPVDTRSLFFNPGEGEMQPCVLDTKDPTSCVEPRSITVAGVTAFVLDWDWLPDEAENAIGQNAPLVVRLFD